MTSDKFQKPKEIPPLKKTKYDSPVTKYVFVKKNPLYLKIEYWLVVKYCFLRRCSFLVYLKFIPFHYMLYSYQNLKNTNTMRADFIM